MSVITLTTDFGIQDEYVGVLKGVIFGINPQATIIDLTHGIDAQDVVQAVYLLRAAYHYFPAGTIHMVVVDPGVGSQRSIIAARYDSHCFLAPDNGLLDGVMGENQPDALVRVENTDLFLKPISDTFHGRDVFAPVAAHLSLGTPLESLGPSTTPHELVRLALGRDDPDHTTRLSGRIISVDHFGNLITDIAATSLARLVSGTVAGKLRVQVGDRCVHGLSDNYAQAGAGQALALIGSRGTLEIAVNGASAARMFNVSKGTIVRAGLVTSNNWEQ